MTSSNKYQELEKVYAKFVGTEYAVAVSSGTAGLHLALVGLGVGIGDEVIVPDFTMAACGFAVSYTGAKVVTIDCGEDLNIDVTRIEEKITPNTRVIMAVHIYGRLCNMKAIKEIADRHKLHVIEDGCEAQGVAKGGYSDCLVFSFYKNKIINAEEGGIICTNDEKLALRLHDLKNMAFGARHDYFHTKIGFNYRMPNSQATLALTSLAQYEENIIKRRKFEKQMSIVTPSSLPKRDTVWVYDFLCKSMAERDRLIGQFHKEGRLARHFFKPLSSMPMWKQPVGENAKRYSQLGMYIPFDEGII